jgi:nitroreductase
MTTLANQVDAALITRRSIRAFLPTPVLRAEIEAILEAASRAPSCTNTQPWKVYVVTGESLARLSRDLLAAYDDPQRDALYHEEYPYYPQRWVSPYIDRVMERGSWLDYGMFPRAIMTAARGRGLDTCPQAAFTQFHRVIAKHLDLPEDEQLVCGRSLGFADESALANTLRTEREPVERFTRFLD